MTQQPASPREHLAAFLSCYGLPTTAEIDLWEDALANAPGDLRAALAAWLRAGDQKPKPIDILNIMLADRRTPINMRRIALDVAAAHSITWEEIMGAKRDPHIAHPRQEAMFKMRKAGFSLGNIATFFGRHHTTILYGARAHKARLPLPAMRAHGPQ